MTEREVLELPAREENALVAEKVMGGPEENPYWYWFRTTDDGLPAIKNTGLPPMFTGPDFTTTWDGLGRVVERMQELGYLLDLRIGPKETTAKFFTVDQECAMVVLSEFARSHEDPKLAVILAALDARGVIE